METRFTALAAMTHGRFLIFISINGAFITSNQKSGTINAPYVGKGTDLVKKPISIVRLLALLGLLSACESVSYAREWTGKLKQNAASSFRAKQDDPSYARAKLKLSSGFGEGNVVYSPTSAMLTDFVYSHRLGDYSFYVNNALNAEDGVFKICSKSVVASTNEVEETRREDYLAHGVDVYVGAIPALEASLADHFGQKVTLNGNPGDYVLSKLTLDDRFPLPLREKSLPFEGQGSFTYASYTGVGLYASEETYSAVTIRIGQTSLAFFLPKDGIELKEFNTDFILSSSWKEGRVSATAPQFSISSSHRDTEESREIVQDCRFDFNRYGVHGEAFTINGPTAMSPEYDFSLTLDRPFFFLSSYRNLPIFIGQVTKL